jgi:MFS family permease
LSLIARHLAGRLAGLASLLLLSFHPEFFRWSRAIMADVPATSLATVAIGFGWWYSRSGRRRWLIVSILCLALGLMIKQVTIFALPLVLLLIAWRYVREPAQPSAPIDRQQAIRRIVSDGLLAAALLILPAVLAALIFDVKAIIAQDFNFIGALTSRCGTPNTDFVADALYRSKVIGGYLWMSWGWVSLALFGLVTIIVFDLKRGWPVLVWLLLPVGLLLFDPGVNSHHLVILLPPLALATSVGVGYLWRFVWTHRADNPGRLVWQIGGALSLILYLVYIPTQLAGLKGEEQPVIEGRQEMINFIRQATFEDDCIITDDPMVAFQADRLTPPELAETSNDRITCGYLTIDDLIAYTEAHDCPVVVFTKKNRFRELLPAYYPWVKTHYLIHRDYPHDELFYVKRSVHSPRSEPLAQLDNRILFWGFQTNLKQWQAGQRVPLRFFWEASEPIKDEYKVFVHLRNGQNQTVAQADHLPFDGALSTSSWQPGDVVAEDFWLDLPAELPAGNYGLVAGLYHPDTGERLPVTNDTSMENAIILGTIKVESP